MNIIINFFYNYVIYIVSVCCEIESFFAKHFSSFKKRKLQQYFEKCDVKVNGDRVWDIKVNDEKFYHDVVTYGPLGFGESYMKGYFDCDRLDELNLRLYSSGMGTTRNRFYSYLLLHFFNLQTKARSWEVGKKHYDLGNDLFSSFLDPTMNYSCGYWRNSDNLNDAQVNKMKLIAKKLDLKPGMRILDIGCGWGSLCKYLSDNYDVYVVGCTISEEQKKLAENKCDPSKVEIRLIDYRQINEKFDRIVSVGMFEHVGESNYKVYFDVANRCLTNNGIFLLHTIGINHIGMPLYDPWFDKYIFPNGMIPYYKHITQYTEGKFIIEDWHNFGPDYDKTLLAWFNKFEQSWPKLEPKYGKEFYRIWKYYLLMGAGMFRSRRLQLWQIVLSKNGIIGGYESQR